MDEPRSRQVRHLFDTKFDRRLSMIVGVALALFGTAEFVVRLDDPLPLLFWLPTLWGGAAGVLVGAFAVGHRPVPARTLVVVGGVLGLVPTMWTLVMPVAIITLLVRVAVANAPLSPGFSGHEPPAQGHS